MIGVLVVDDHALMRRTLRAILDGQPDLKVIGEAADGVEAIDLCQTVRPDVVLMDMYMPRMDGIEAARHLGAIVPESCIIGMSSDSSGWVENAFLSAGARAFLPKEMVPAHLLDVIHRECRRSPRNSRPF
jgi:DNA-binding NarL/FixJ family response regulator